MKKNKNHLALLLTMVFLIALVAACKKSSSNNSSITVQNLSGSYTLTDITVTVPGFGTQSVLDSVPACQRDDIIKLNTDMTSEQVDAGTKCNPTSAATGTWALSGNSITIDSATFNIQKFDGKVLMVSTDVTIQNITATTTETLTKQ